MSQNYFNGTWSHAPAYMPNSVNTTWSLRAQQARPQASTAGMSGNLFSYGAGTGRLLSNGAVYVPAPSPSTPTPIVRPRPNNFGPGNGPGGYGDGGFGGNGTGGGGGDGYYGGGDPY